MRVRAVLLAVCLLVAWQTAPAAAALTRPERVLVFAFDNTSLADIQRMPSLWHFLADGALSEQHHTVLPTRSAPGFAAIATGLYADRSGALDNSFVAGGRRESGFTFWETRLGNGRPFGLAEPPWAAFNRAGYDVGAVGFNPLVLQTDADVRRLARMANPEERRAAAYRGVALYEADGGRLFGAPDIPWLWPEVGPFPGWPLRAMEYPLTVTALMQEHGVAVTFTYLENLHGTAPAGGYEDTIARTDAAFAAFFARLAAAGITADNSLFVFTTDEGDALSPAGGRSIALGSWLEQHPLAALPADDLLLTGGAAANLYLAPGSDAAAVAAAASDAPGVAALAWGAALRATRTAVAGDPSRTPDLTVYGEQDIQFRDRGRAIVGRTAAPLWNHGTLGDAMERVWLAARGPGIRPGAVTAWSDHVDILPTVHVLLGMADAGLDGQVMVALLDGELLPPGAGTPAALRLAVAVKQAAAPLGPLTRATLRQTAATARRGDLAAMRRADAATAAWMDRRDALLARARAAQAELVAGRAVDAEVVAALSGELAALLDEVKAAAD